MASSRGAQPFLAEGVVLELAEADRLGDVLADDGQTDGSNVLEAARSSQDLLSKMGAVALFALSQAVFGRSSLPTVWRQGEGQRPARTLEGYSATFSQRRSRLHL